MGKAGRIALLTAAALLAAFTADVALGAFLKTSWLGDVGEMLTLLAASCAFVIGVLQRESAAAADRASRP